MEEQGATARPPAPPIDWNAPGAYARATAASVTGVGIQGLVEEYTIDTPENVAFRYEIAGIGSRSIGGIVDTAIIGTLLIVLFFAIVIGSEYLTDWMGWPEVQWLENLFIALYFLLDFAIFWGYYLLFELFWNGQTPGKRVARTRVVQSDGMPAGFAEIAVRNLVRIIDFLPTAYALGLITMFSNASARRLGDLAAGTLVIHDQGEVTLASLLAPDPMQDRTRRRVRQNPAPTAPTTPEQSRWSNATPPESQASQFPVSRSSASQFAVTEGPFGADLSALSAEEIDLIRDALTREWRGQLPDGTLQRLAQAIAVKTGAPPPVTDRSSVRRFLTKIADAWSLANG